ncbi:MAG: hypothetical protein JRM98_03815 [Nitrososphaerota archaeon]|jgi:hypothetical protein|nr:hypothetical protein [Nitrososphaerota archaeon]
MTAHKANAILIIALVAMLGFISYTVGIAVYQQHETGPAVVPPGSLGPRMTVMYLLPYNYSTGTLNNSYATDLLYYSHNVLSVWPNALANETVQLNINLGVSNGMFPVLQLTDLNITSYTVYLEIANVNQKAQDTTGGVLYTVSFNPVLPIYTSSGTLSSIPPSS